VTDIDQRVINAHTEWMRENAAGLRKLDLSQTIDVGTFESESLRQRLIDDMGSQIARDAFSRGLGLIALSPPQYFVHSHMGAWMDPDRLIAREHSDWLAAPPPASMLAPNTLIEIKIEAFGFPIGKREV
jgi:hypothetical protein